MLIIVLFLLFISIILLSISSDITRMKETFERLYSIAWRWYASSDVEEDEEDDI